MTGIIIPDSTIMSKWPVSNAAYVVAHFTGQLATTYCKLHSDPERASTINLQ